MTCYKQLYFHTTLSRNIINVSLKSIIYWKVWNKNNSVGKIWTIIEITFSNLISHLVMNQFDSFSRFWSKIDTLCQVFESLIFIRVKTFVVIFFDKFTLKIKKRKTIFTNLLWLVYFIFSSDILPRNITNI